MNRILVVAALAAFLGAPLSSNPLDRLWSALGSLWESPVTLKEGCGWDPSGLTSCNSAPALETDAGCGWDPDGLNDSPAPTTGP